MTSQPPPSRTRRTAMSILSGVLVGSTTFWGAPSAGADPSTSPSDPTQATVRYELTGTGVAAYVTYATDSNQQHATDVSLPWAMQVTRIVASYASTYASVLSAQGAGPGTITCIIKVDGKVVSQNTATGDPARVVCESHQGRNPQTSSTTTTTPPAPIS
jgi:hypothetical protein